MFPAAHFPFCQRPLRSYSASEIKSTEQIAPMNPASLDHTDDVTYWGGGSLGQLLLVGPQKHLQFENQPLQRPRGDKDLNKPTDET